MSANTTPIGPFSGINNRLPDHQLGVYERGQKSGDYLRNAVNVDLTAVGTLQRRKGYALAHAGGACHSLWSDGERAFFVDGDELKQVGGGVLATGLTPGRPVSFCRIATGEVVWTDGVRLEAIGAGPLAVPTPNPAPTVVANLGGGLFAGHYQVAITSVTPRGLESGSTWPVQVRVPDGGRIEVSNLPPGETNIYVSPLNGDRLYLIASTTASSYVLPTLGMAGVSCPTLNLRPLPPGRIVREYHGRLLVADKQGIYYSEPWMYGLYNPLRGFIQMPGITIMEPGSAGVFVATETQTYWLAGQDIDQLERVDDVLPYGAVEGTATRLLDSDDVAWFSTRGLVIGKPEGQVANVQESTVAVGGAQAGASMHREQDGMRQLVTALSGSEVAKGAAASFFSAEVIRKESMQ